MKIICESNTIYQKTDTDPDLADMRFYVPMSEDNYIYIAKFNHQFVPLREVAENTPLNKAYKLCNLGNAFQATQVSLVRISKDFKEVSITNAIPISVVNEKYISEGSALASSIVSANIGNMYEKIIEMTKMNIKIHEELKGATE